MKSYLFPGHSGSSLCEHLSRSRSLRLLPLLLILLALVLLLALSSVASARELHVDDDASPGGAGSEDRPFSNIQQAVDSAEDGDVIKVKAGSYRESLLVDKRLSLQGEVGKCDILYVEGSEKPVVTLDADGINMSGFSVSGGKRQGLKVRGSHTRVFGNAFSGNDRGVELYITSSHTHLFNNSCHDNYHSGIHLSASDNNTIANNSCSGNNYVGIEVFQSRDNLVENNRCSGSVLGISVSEGGWNNTLWSNTCEENVGAGIRLSSNRNSILVGNRLQGKGILIEGDLNKYFGTHEIRENTVNGKPVSYMKDRSDASGQKVPEDVGQLILVNSRNILAEGLDCSSETMSILVYGCSNITLRKNSVAAGIHVHYSCRLLIEDNLCSLNNMPDGVGIFLEKSNHSTIRNNVCSFNAEDGISLKNRCHNITIAGNRCHGNRETGILAFGSHIDFLDNQCSGNEHGISTDSDHGLVINNSCTKNNRTGIDISGSWFTVSRNSCSGNGPSNTIGNGLTISSSEGTRIENNSFLDNSAAGVNISWLWKSHIINNTVSRNQEGFFLDRIVSGNRSGVFLEGAWGDNVMEYNFIHNNSGYGFRHRSWLVHPDEDVEISPIRKNYWGSDSGPYHLRENPTGQGDEVGDGFDFRPWLDSNGVVNLSSSNLPVQEEEDETGRFFVHFLVAVLGGIALAASYFCFEGFRFLVHRLLNPLYTRLGRDDLERDIGEETLRGEVYTFVREQPGSSLSGIKRGLNIGYGTTIYHLGVLMREGYLRSSLSGREKRFWTKQGFPGTELSKLTEQHQLILDVLRDHGELSRASLRELTGLPKSTLGINIKQLERMGKLVEERRGKHNYCSLRLY